VPLRPVVERVGVLPDRPLAGTGRVDERSIELVEVEAGQRVVARVGVGHREAGRAEPFGVESQRGDAPEVVVVRDDRSPIVHQGRDLGGLPAGSGTAVPDPLARLGSEDDRRHRRDLFLAVCKAVKGGPRRTRRVGLEVQDAGVPVGLLVGYAFLGEGRERPLDGGFDRIDADGVTEWPLAGRQKGVEVVDDRSIPLEWLHQARIRVRSACGFRRRGERTVVAVATVYSCLSHRISQ